MQKAIYLKLELDELRFIQHAISACGVGGVACDCSPPGNLSHSLSAHTKLALCSFLACGRNMDLSDPLFSGLSLQGKHTAVPQKILNTLQNMEVPHLPLFPFTHLIYTFNSPASNVSFFFGHFSFDVMYRFVSELNSHTFKISGI